MFDGLFGDMFDLNNDGDMDLGEEIIETGFVMDMLDSDDEDSDFYEDDDDDEFDEDDDY